MLPIIPREVLVWFCIVLPELFYHVLTHVTMIFFHFCCNLHLILRWDTRHFTALSHQIQNELCDIPPSDRDVFDSAPDDIAFYAWNNMRDAVPRINNCTSECPVSDPTRRPGGSEREDRLNSDVETLDIERLKEDLCSLFSVLRCIEGGFSLVRHRQLKNTEVADCNTNQEEVVILGLCTQILKDRLLPVSLHMIPIADHPVLNRVVQAVTR